MTRKNNEWPAGPWDVEKDQEEWRDEVTGFICEIWRNRFGALCGYVSVEDHASVVDKDLLIVHGGITYEEGNTFGFDCSHGFDYSPGLGITGGPYRSWQYVREETESLAKQLHDQIQNKRETHK